jgi:DNA-binding transcriptional LysR family regulator
VAWRLQLADAQIAELAGQRRDHLRLGAFPTALATFVPAAIARLRITRGDLRVRLSEVTADSLEPRMLAGEFDVAVGYQESIVERREHQDAERLDLFQETFLIGLPPQHPLAGDAGRAGSVSLAQLADDDWIMPSAEGFLVQACRDAGFEPRIVSVTSDPLATRGLITRGLGVGWVAGLLRHDCSGVAIRPVRDPMRRRDIYALLPPGDRHPAAADLVEALTATAASLGESNSRPQTRNAGPPRYSSRYGA